ncbi:MAG TPA: hypothetical protein VMM76_02375 [Pirellulaceae bacterium]|nr:hypothetical protein [Pirellulaceae bacterium]
MYDAFDPGNLAEKHASRFDKTPRSTNVVTNITITPPGDYFKLFRIKGNIPDEGLDDVLSSLRTELSDLAKTSRVKLIHGPKNTMGDRPIHLLSVLFLGATVELKTLRGFYFTYEDGEIVGAVDTFAIRYVDENTRHWKIVCAVHEAKR